MSAAMEKLQNILRNSKRYEMNGSILTLTDYYTGESISLDLSQMSEESLEEMIVEEEEEEDDIY